MKSCAAIIASLFVIVSVSAKPDRPLPPPVGEAKKAEEKIPQVAMVSNWGTVTQEGRKLTINGHEHWEATGEIRKDGTVFLLWVLCDSGREAQGLYKIDDKRLVGQWGYAEEVTILPDGSIVAVPGCSLSSDVTHPINE